MIVNKTIAQKTTIFMLAFLLIAGMSIPLSVLTADKAYAKSYDYKAKKSERSVAFRVSDLDADGVCCQAGKDSKTSGSASAEKLKQTDPCTKVAYYYGHAKGLTYSKYENNGTWNKYFLLMQWAGHDQFGNDKPSSDWKNYEWSKDEYAKIKKKAAVPDNFTAWHMEVKSYQDFVVGKYVPPGSATIQKVARNSAVRSLPGYNSFAGCTYTLYNSSGTAKGTFTIKADGTSNKIENLAPGTYYVKEAKTNAYWKLNTNQSASFTVSSNKTATKKLNGTSELEDENNVSIKIKKEVINPDETSKDEMFTVKLVNTINKAFAYSAQVKGDGTPTTLTNVKAGTYQVTEIISEEQKEKGYKDVTGTQTITIGINETGKVITRQNKLDPNRNITLMKSTTDGGPLNDFKFRITGVLDNAGTITQEQIKTAASPTVTIKEGSEAYTIGEWTVDSDDVDAINQDAENMQTGVKSVKMTSKATLDPNKVDEISSVVTAKSEMGEAKDAWDAVKPEGAQDLESPDDEIDDSEFSNEAKEALANYKEKMQAYNDLKDSFDDIDLETTVSVNLKDAKKTQVNPIKYENLIENKTSSTDEKDKYTVQKNDFDWTGAKTKYKDAETDEEYTMLKTDANGNGLDSDNNRGIENLYFGTYTAEEIMTDAQKTKYHQPEPQVITIDKNDKTMSFSFEFVNEDKAIPILLKKSCEDGKISGVTFHLTGTNALGETVDETDITDENGEADFNGVKLYKGNYVIEETSFDPTLYENNHPLEGYDNPAIAFTITGEEESTVEHPYEVPFTNKPITTFFVTKVDKDSLSTLSGAEFELLDSNKETVAKFAILKEELEDVETFKIDLIESKDGIAVSDFVASDYDTKAVDINGNEIAEPEDGFTYVALKNLKDGEQYTIKETKSPEGYSQYIEGEFTFTNLMKLVIENKPAEIGTTATDKDTGKHQGNADKSVTVVDTIAYKNLMEGREYIASGVLMYKPDDIKADAEPVIVNGGEVVVSKRFTAGKDGNGTVDVEFTFDGTVIQGKSVVAYETVVDPKIEAVIATHEDPEDEGQTVDYPKIRTTLVDSKESNHVALAEETVLLNDIVHYENLVAGKEYTVLGILMDKATGKPAIVDGNQIKASKTFTAPFSGKELEEGEIERVSGDVTVPFEFNGTSLEGTSVVAFEELYVEGDLIGEHKDITDEGQTVDFPKIRTTLTANDTKMHVTKASEEVTITDVVSYENLLPDTEYVMSGVLMDKNTGEEIKINGQPVTATQTFTPQKGLFDDENERVSGEVELTFTFDASTLKGTSVVAFEELTLNGKLIGEHKDITDEEQTVDFPKLGTTAIANDTKLHVTNANQKISITDTVSYENLRPNTEYVMKGVLMDKKTGEPAKANGKEITSEKSFVTGAAEPEKTRVSGSVNLIFEFEGKSLEGTSLVAFEELFIQGELIGEHKEIKDEEQTVDIPKIRTKATAGDTQNHITMADDEITITDVVSYENLIVGTEYVMSGTLMDKETQEPIKVNGNLVKSSAKFIPNKDGESYTEPQKDENGNYIRTSGKVELKFVFNGSELKDVTTVAFEELSIDGKLIGEHKDINDKEQSVKIPKIGTTASRPSKNVVKDVVEYSNLLPGETYIMRGTLIDKKSESKIKGATAEKEFTPSSANGKVTIKFDVDAKKMGDRKVVAFEECYIYKEDGNTAIIAEHKDIHDEAQTVEFKKKEKPRTGQAVPWILIVLITVSTGAGIYAVRNRKKLYS